MNKHLKSILMKAWGIAHRAGYDIRKAEEHCWPDQVALLGESQVSVVFDVGANAGDVTARYRGLFPEATVHCFEPLPGACDHLRRRYVRDAKVTVQQAAVTDLDGECNFTVNCADDSSSLLEADVEGIPDSYQRSMSPAHSLTVPAVTIDRYCASLNIPKIDILKLDIQGGELRALKGAGNALRSRSIRLIYSEVFFLPFYTGQPLFGDQLAFLAQLGYVLHGIYNPAFSGQTGRLQWADCIFVNEELAVRSRELMRTSMRA